MITIKTNPTTYSLKLIAKKAFAGFLAGVFLFTSTLGWALAPQSEFNIEEFKGLLTVAAICKHIEHDGNLDDRSYLNDVLARLDAPKNSNIKVFPHEIIVEIPNEALAVRYFDPTKANVITPYSDISKLSTKVIGPRLHRQIIHRMKALPAPESLDQIVDASKIAPPAEDMLQQLGKFREMLESYSLILNPAGNKKLSEIRETLNSKNIDANGMNSLNIEQLGLTKLTATTPHLEWFINPLDNTDFGIIEILFTLFLRWIADARPECRFAGLGVRNAEESAVPAPPSFFVSEKIDCRSESILRRVPYSSHLSC